MAKKILHLIPNWEIGKRQCKRCNLPYESFPEKHRYCTTEYEFTKENAKAHGLKRCIDPN